MNVQQRRLASGGRIDRNRPLNFYFDGERYAGFAGDTLASALLANGVRVAGRSFKLHRPRGVFGQWCEEPNVIVQVGEGAQSTPNLKATQVELFDGLKARSVNTWPSAGFDVLAPLQKLSRFMPAGFYYKTFMWPNWSWFEPTVRRAAGLGHAPTLPDPDRYAERHAHCDVLVVGGGPAGLSAALAAQRAGASVMLIDDRPLLGGALQWESHLIDGKPALQWVSETERALRAAPRTRVLTRTTAFGCYDHNSIALNERLTPAAPAKLRERLWLVRARQVVIAAGAIERPMVFADNDVPGVMLASAAVSYAVQYAVKPGRRAVVVTSCDSGYSSAEALHASGVDIAAVVDTRFEQARMHESLHKAGIPVLNGHAPARIHGRRAVQAVDVRPLARNAKGWGEGESQRLKCDLACVAGGWTPTVHLFSQARGALRYSSEHAALLPEKGPDNLRCAGSAAGAFALDDCLSEGFNAGRVAAAATGALMDCGAPASSAVAPQHVSAHWASPPSGRRKAWVDLQNDVTRGDLELAVRENLRSVEHVKRYTTAGMAVDQGKTSNMNALGVIAALTDRSIAEVGATTFRPPYDPVTLGALVGRRVGELYHCLRRTPLDEWHQTYDAVLEDYGGWRRPAWYLRNGLHREQCIRLEKRAARQAVSLFDGSPLGKIEVRGRDAATFLQRMYYNNMRTLATGRGRYGVMLNEHGVIVDDGVCLRLADDHFLVSTTSGGVTRIFESFESWLQCDWPDLDVRVTNVTSAWGTIAVAGPRARELLQRLSTDIDLTRDSFPHLAIRCGELEGVPVRIARVGFTGELSFEISIPAGYTASLWELLLACGADLQVAPIGLEALLELRTEKGFLHVGTDTDGRTLPADIGMGELLLKKPEDFVGRRSLTRADALRPDRLQFVGIAVDDSSWTPPVGAHVIAAGVQRGDSEGYVTSSCYSETLGRSVALGLVLKGRARLGQAVGIYFAGTCRPARIVAPAWYDAKGDRLNA